MKNKRMPTKIQTDSHDLADRLHSAAIHLLRKLRREDESSGLNAPRLSALSVIVFGGPLSLRDLAAAEQVRPPTMTRIVSALEEQGLVVKERDARDARSIRLSPTAAGRQLLLEGRKRRVDSLARQIAELSATERKKLHEGSLILAELIRAI
jgi:DNA-binding MarR family transcriptional regulator